MTSATESSGGSHHHNVRTTKRQLNRNLEPTRGKNHKGKKGGHKTKGTKMPSSMPSMNPTMLPTITTSSQPSASNQPSLSPAPSSAPSLSGAPSKAPSDVPSVEPSVSNMPSTSQVPSLAPSESMEPTCIDNYFRQRNNNGKVGGKGGGKRGGKGKGHIICDSASPSQEPSISNAPSTSSQPSTGPSLSNAPSSSSVPSYLPSSTPTCGKGKGGGCQKVPKKSRNNPDGSHGGSPPLTLDTRSAEASSASKESYPKPFWLGNSIASMMLLVALFALALWD